MARQNHTFPDLKVMILEILREPNTEDMNATLFEVLRRFGNKAFNKSYHELVREGLSTEDGAITPQGEKFYQKAYQEAAFSGNDYY